MLFYEIGGPRAPCFFSTDSSNLCSAVRFVRFTAAEVAFGNIAPTIVQMHGSHPVVRFQVNYISTLMGAVTQYAMRAGEKLRQHGLVAGRVTVFFHTNPHKPGRQQYTASRTLSAQPMTNDGLALLAYARRGVESAWREGYGITKAGIMLEDLMPADLRPRTLFEGDCDRRARLMTAMDEVNGRFGKFTAVPAVQGFKRQWGARSESRSPNYTTRIAEVPTVSA